MKRYFFSKALITTPGKYEYRIINNKEFRKWLRKENFDEKWAKIILYSEIYGASRLESSQTPNMEVGDEAIIFQLSKNVDLEEVTVDYVFENCEVGILKRLA